MKKLIIIEKIDVIFIYIRWSFWNFEFKFLFNTFYIHFINQNSLHPSQYILFHMI